MEIPTPISDCDSKSITIRDLDLSSEIMGELGFGEAAYLIITGDLPSESESILFNTMLTSLLAHGMTSHAVTTRLTYAAEPDSVQGAVAAGVLGIGSRSAGAVRSCAETIRQIAKEDDSRAALDDIITSSELEEPFGVTGFSGIGHASFDESDPRAEKILQTANQVNINRTHTELLSEIRRAFEASTNAHLPENVIGAISAVSLDMGLSPEAAQGIAILSRTAGLVAEVNEENNSPVASNIRNIVAENLVYRPNE